MVEAELSRHFEKIHGMRDFLPARFLAAGAERARAVCRVRTSTSWGTGFLIGHGVLMTNNHVLGSIAEASVSYAEFGFEDGAESTKVALLPGDLFITDPELDFTIVACETTGIEEHPTIPLRRDPAMVAIGERVSIVQHPRARPKEIALHDNKVVAVKDLVVHYRTDTEPGSSGSPVFNVDWELVALHHAGWKDDAGAATNEGVRIATIVNRLLRHHRDERHEGLSEALARIDDTSLFLGFFDTWGVERTSRGRDLYEVELPDYRGTADFADIGIWNIEHFNDRVSDRRIQDVGSIIARLNLDIMGLVEVQRDALRRLQDDLLRRGWETQFDVQDENGSQDLGVIWDEETSKVRLRRDLLEEFAEQIGARTPTGRTAFPRRPLFADCRVAQDGRDVEFTLILLHLKAFGDPQSRARRELAAEKLAEIVDALGDEKPVVIGGDFNELITSDALAPLATYPDMLSLTTDDANDGALSYVGARHRSLIDHFIVSADARLGDIRADDAAIIRFDQTVRGFVDKVSDHVPLVIRMVFHEGGGIAVQPSGPDDVVSVPIPEGVNRLQLEFGRT